MKALESNALWPYGITAFFALLTLIGIFNHEIWLDEAHHWLLARDSDSMGALIKNTRYEGHPILWNIFLFLISRITTNPLWMQLLHIVFAVTAVFVFLKKAPFPILFKLLFIFGYFMLYEYAVISRNYGIGVLFLFLACSRYPKRNETPVLLALLLAIAANTHALILVVAAAFFAMVLLEQLLEKGIRLTRSFWIATILFSFGVLTAYLQILPPEDSDFFQRLRHVPLIKKLSSGYIAFFKALVFIPKFNSLHFWNTNLITALSKPLAAVLGFAALLLPYLMFRKNTLILIFIYLNITGISFFFVSSQLVGARYHGILFMVWIIALWIYQYRKQNTREEKTADSLSSLPLYQKRIVYGILLIHAVSGVVAYGMDIRYPFTNAPRAISYLDQNGLSQKIVATKACDGSALSTYLERPVYFTSSASFESFCQWGAPESNLFAKKQQVIYALTELFTQEKETIIYMSFEPTFSMEKPGEWVTLSKDLQFRFLKKFEGSILRKGNYYIYEMGTL